MIEYNNLDNTHLDLRCDEMDYMAREEPMEMPEIPDEIREIMEERAALIPECAIIETSIVEPPSVHYELSVPRDTGPLPMPPDVRFKNNSKQPTDSELEIWTSPNPFNSSVDIHVRLPKNEKEVKVEIFDMSGRRIRGLEQHTVSETGGFVFRWDGKDSEARICPTGVYHYKMTSTNREATGTVLLTK
ncbi:T9SS type A sorting domain-containing protein [bacterium]|nr:T9SS type A sorting domain-containing protein [bacterium]